MWLKKAFTRFTLCIACLLIVVSLCAAVFDTTAAASAQGDGIVVYGEGTVTTPRARTWTQASTSWGSEASTPVAAASVRHVTTESSPKRDEAISGIQSTGGVLYVQRWNGTAWSSEWSVTVGSGNLPRFDIAYERNSGDALIVYGANAGTTNELRYRRWNGSAWTAEASFDAVRTSGIIHAVRLAAHAGSLNDDIALAWGDANLDLSANYWDGAANTWGSEPTSALSASLSVVGTATALTNWSFDVALESSSGDMLVVWGNNTVQDVFHATRSSGAAGTWGSAITNSTAAEEGTDLALSSDPGSDYIAYVNITDNSAGAEAATWTGNAWNTFANFDTTSGTVAASTKNITVSWLRSGSQDRAVVTYEDAATSNGIDWLFYNKNTNAWSALQTDFTTAPAPATDIKTLRQVSNPFNSAELMVVAIDSASDIFAKRLTFDGTNFTWSSSEPGGAALELTASSIIGFAVDFAYARYTPGTLSVDIVDGSGNTVGSPSITMSTANVSLECQAIIGTFGTASQKIRVTNGTATPGWTLSAAATAGATALWSSGTAQYDFNDSGGSPAGCGDGADADAHGGSLSLNPAAGGIAPQSGCSASGISLGSAGTFAQDTLDSVALANASSGAGTACYWDLTNIAVSQQLPGEKPAGNYTINLTLTITAN